MTTISEIEAAIEKLPDAQIEELARWLEARRQMRASPLLIENWLKSARGAGIPGVTTDEVMAQTRGEE